MTTTIDPYNLGPAHVQYDQWLGTAAAEDDITVNSDGDLTPIVLLPALEELRMQDRRHYHPRVKDIRSALAKRMDTP